MQPSQTPRDRFAELLRVARAAPRPGSPRFAALVERCVAEHLRRHEPPEVVVLDAPT